MMSFHAAGGRLVSGFLTAPGMALTRSVPLGDGSAVKLLNGRGEETAVEVAKQDDGAGLALVSLPGFRAEPLQLGDAAALHSGDRLFFAVPTDGLPILQEGALGATTRQIQGIAYLALEGNPPSGSEGGPVLDLQGRVVGLVAIQKDGAYLLPINYAYAESHLVEPPEPAPDPNKWVDLLADVAAAERLRVDASR